MGFGLNRFILEFSLLGNLGVIIYSIITGYYGIHSNNINIKKILSLWLSVSFYSILFYFVFIYVNNGSWSIFGFLKTILPITFNQYWFASVYIIFMFFSPFINSVLNKLNKKEYLLLIFMLFLFFSFIPFISFQDTYTNNFILFVLYYSIGGFISKHIKSEKEIRMIKFCGVLSFLLLLILVLVFVFSENYFSFLLGKSAYLFDKKDPLILLLAVGFFIYFISKKKSCNRIINYVASLTFGVYLIHDNIFVREFLWKNLLNVKNIVFSNGLLIYYIIIVLLVFIVSCFIEMLKIVLFNKLFDNVSSKIANYLKKIMMEVEKIYERLF